MTLYFDYTVNIEDPVAAVVTLAWHTQQGLLAVASFSQETGGTVAICDELGESVKDVHQTRHTSSTPLGLAWHPTRRTLISSWENGEIRVWNGEKEFVNINSPHSSPVLFVRWSQMGGRLVSIDANGMVVGWRVDSLGQLTIVYQQELPAAASCLEFRHTRPGPDLTNLARRAVAGDQRALDMFSAWRPRTAGQRTTHHTDNMSFFVATRTGNVYYINESGKCQEVLTVGGRIEKILYHERDDSLIILSDGLSLGYYSVSHDGLLNEITKVKLSGIGMGSSASVVWAGTGIVACAVGEMIIRCWEPSTGDSYSLPVTLLDTQMMGVSSKSKQSITALAYSSQKGILCGCTNMGTVLFWRSTADGWEQMPGSRVRGHIQECCWGGTNLAVNTSSVAYVLREHSLCAAYNSGLSAVQISASQLIISSLEGNVELKTDVKVSGVCISKDNIAVWSGKTVVVYQSAPLTSLNVISSFTCESENVQLYEQSLIILEMKGHVQIMTFQGTIKQTLDCDSTPIGIHLNNAHLVIYTISGVLYLWDLTRREAKAVSQPKDLMESIDDFGEVICARVNSNGTKVSISIAGVNLLPVPSLYVWDIESNSISSHSFSAKSDGSECTRFVMNHYWDQEEPRLVVAEAKRVPPSSSNTGPASVIKSKLARYASNIQQPVTLLVSIISSPSHGLLVQDTTPVSEDFVSLLAVDTPYYVVLIKPPDKQWVTEKRLLMKDFVGIDKCDNQTRSAILNFSFSLSIGDIDQAFKTIRNVKSVAVWSNLAKLCVKARRLDVAGVCLGHTRDARGVAALREAQSYPQHEAKLATLAVHLGLIDEAETLYESCGRWDLLNKLYQSKDQWDRALKLAEEKDRIHLRHTYHAYAKYLEERGDTEGAAQMYQRADTHRYQVMRMLLDDPVTLESYVLKSKDSSLIKWWAQYMESSGDMELAMKFYKEAEDHLSMVRVMCFLEEFDRAAEIASSSGDKAACYHLARQYENMGLIQEAIHFFTRATAYANAIRMCKEQNLDEQLWTLALSAGTREQIEAAKHLESTAPDKSVLLYHRAGMLRRALDLAFRCEQFDAVQLIATELDADADEELLMKCAHFFMEKQHYEKAVSLLAIAKKYTEGISLSWEHSVPLNEELAEALTPSPGHPDRSSLLEHLAECALAQANYHLATKKFTQAGNKVKAMKALLKSGDTEKIIFFATVSRQREIYVMAGNYLQSLDWQAQPELLKNIVTFYTKGRAPHLLANFYMSCAQVEIDEYGNYEKALGALNEAARCLVKDSDQFPQVAEAVARKTALVKKFIDTRRLLEKGEIENGLQQCRQLLSMPSDLVRIGDIYSVMIEQATKTGDWKLASQLAQELRKAQPHDNLALYIPRGIMERLGLTDATPEDEPKEQEIEEVVEEEET